MNLLQTFMADANAQARDLIQEVFTITGLTGTFYGTFGDPEILPVMTRQGYQDHLVTPLKVETTQFAALTSPQVQALARGSLIRTQTNRTFFIQVVDYTGVVVWTFILTDREL
jgi:hypothetical protein